jgi:hypothetical protein
MGMMDCGRIVTDDTAFFRFGPVARPVAFVNCAPLSQTIAARLNGWAVAPWPETTARPEPVITVTRRENDYALASDTIKGEEIYEGDTNIVCAFIAELVMAFGAADPETLFLHAGGAVVGDRLVIYPARGKTGKSTLTAELAARGARVFTDDVVPVNLETGKAMALGIEPHLRKPLPDALPAAERRWIEDHVSIANARMAYLGLPRAGAGALAPLGETRRIGAFVLLKRNEGARPRLESCPRVDLMKLIIRQHFGAARPAPEILPRFKALIESAPCWRVTYSGGDEAARLIEELASKP